MYFIGIDLSRTTAHYFVSDEAGKRLASGKIELSATELIALYQRFPCAEIALEASPATFRLARALEKVGAKVFVVNTRTNFLIRQSMQKTDALDAKMLCEQLRERKLPKVPVYVPSAEVEELRNLLAFRAALVKERTAICVRTMGLAARNEVYLKAGALSSKTNWQTTEVSAATWPAAHFAMLQIQRANYWKLDQQVNKLEWQIVETVENLYPKEARLLETIPGIGQLSMAALLAYIADIKRFKNSRQLCNYVGLSPAIRDSGQHKSKLGISKAGNPLLRSYLTQAALTVRRLPEEHPLAKWYAQVLHRRGWQKARIALARKLVAIVFGVLKHQQPFEPHKLLPPQKTRA
jgi:transposase